MILFNHELLFVHNPKTAGTSLLRHLRTALQGPIYSAGVAEVGTYHPSLSRALEHGCAVTGNKPSDFKRILSVMRDPYDREISMYVYFRDVLCSSPSLSVDLNDPSIEKIVRMAGQLSFGDYLSWTWRELGTCDIWRSRYYYRTDEDELPANLRIIKTESLERDLGDSLRGLKRASDFDTLPRLNVSPRRPSDAFSDANTVDIVSQSYRWIFEEGHYEVRNINV